MARVEIQSFATPTVVRFGHGSGSELVVAPGRAVVFEQKGPPEPREPGGDVILFAPHEPRELGPDELAVGAGGNIVVLSEREFGELEPGQLQSLAAPVADAYLLAVQDVDVIDLRDLTSVVEEASLASRELVIRVGSADG